MSNFQFTCYCDEIRAYLQVSCVKNDLKALRNGIDALLLKWYESCVELGKEYDIRVLVLHKCNNTATIPHHLPLCQYYMRWNTFIEHLSSEMDKFFRANKTPWFQRFWRSRVPVMVTWLMHFLPRWPCEFKCKWRRARPLAKQMGESPRRIPFREWD